MPVMRLLLCLLAIAPLAAPQPVRLIFDTDMGNDIDEALVQLASQPPGRHPGN